MDFENFEEIEIGEEFTSGGYLYMKIDEEHAIVISHLSDDSKEH